MAVKDEIGNKYGRLFVLKRVENNHRGDAQWECECDCGNIIITKGISLRSGHTKSCGCLQKEIVKAQGLKNTYDLIGKRFGRLVVVERLIGDSTTRGKWKSACDCGGFAISTSDKLISGQAQSCGCIMSRNVFEIANRLQILNIDFIKEFTFPDLKSPKNYVLRFDFAIVNKMGSLLFLLEYDGSQHFDTRNNFWVEEIPIHDELKNNYCKEKNIKLYRINYKQDAIKELNIILEKEGLYRNEEQYV